MTPKLKPGAEEYIKLIAHIYADKEWPNATGATKGWRSGSEGDFIEGVTWTLANLPKLLEATHIMDDRLQYPRLSKLTISESYSKDFKAVAIIELEDDAKGEVKP